MIKDAEDKGLIFPGKVSQCSHIKRCELDTNVCVHVYFELMLDVPWIVIKWTFYPMRPLCCK